MLEVTKHGQTILFDVSDVDKNNPGSVHQHLFQGDFYEEPFLDYIRSLDLHGTYVDAGAYIGTHSLYFAAICNAKRVYAFEPRSVPRERLTKNISANNLHSVVTVSDHGLAATQREVTVRLDRSSETFTCMPLDDLVKEPVDLMKIDVEGMELDVLRGATRILTESTPVIFAEAHNQELLALLQEYLGGFGYVQTGRVFNASPTYEFVKIPEVHLRIPSSPTTNNLEQVQEQLAKYRKWAWAQAAQINNLHQDLQIANQQTAMLKRQLTAARRSFSFRIGRATTLALRAAKKNPLRAPEAWVQGFYGPDSLLEK